MQRGKNALLRWSLYAPANFDRPRDKDVYGHQMKHWNRNNFAADSLIAFKIGTEFHYITGDTLQMFKVKGQGRSVK